MDWQAVEIHVAPLRRNRGQGGRGATATGGDGDRQGTGPNAGFRQEGRTQNNDGNRSAGGGQQRPKCKQM
eukprot:8303335-Pyramimonas_sp.AAC.1